MHTGHFARFEFRVWGDHLGDAIQRLRARSDHVEHRESAETYLLVPDRFDINPKVRADLLDVKELVAERDGFEQWDVQLKAEFPIPAALVRDELFPLLGVEPAALEHPSYGLAELVAAGGLRAVDVAKRRHIRAMGSCIAEISVATIAGRELTTAAIESEDLDALRDARTALGLDGHDNVSYPRAIYGALAEV